ncbi:MAG: hypothetical protein FDZ70_08795, partial [Actinobacteria bacterium]
MNGIVHYSLTREWALQAGFTDDEAEQVARWNVRTDRGFSGADAWANKRYHLVPFGSRRTALVYLAHAVTARSIPHLGVGLHALQDTIGHGFWGSVLHFGGVDLWERKSPAVRARLEGETREWLEAYLDFRLPGPAGAEGPPAADAAALADLPLPPDAGPVGRQR